MITAQSTIRKEAGNGVKVAFTFPFKCFAETDLEVYRVDADGTLNLLTLTTDYTVALNAGMGGTVTHVSAPPTGGYSIILSKTAYTQETEIPINGRLPEEDLENALDRNCLLSQQLADLIARAPRLPSTDAAQTLVIDAPVDGYALYWSLEDDGLYHLKSAPSSEADIQEAVEDAEDAAAAALVSQTAAAGSAAAALVSQNAAYGFADDASESADEASASAGLAAAAAAVAGTGPRQSILSGLVDANGYAAFLVSSGLDVTSAAAVTVTAAYGFDEYGAKNYIMSQAVAVALPINSTSYIYRLRNNATTFTDYSTTLKPIYGYKYPAAPAEGQFFFHIPAMKMYRYTSGEWVEKIAVFLGEAVTDGTEVTSVTSYALRAQYDSGWFAITGVRAEHLAAHNIGTEQVSVEAYGATSDAGAGMAKFIYNTLFAAAGIDSGYGVLVTDKTVNFVSYDSTRIADAADGSADATHVRLFVKRVW